jgi:hypothetical protein
VTVAEHPDQDAERTPSPRAPRTNLLLAATIEGAFGTAAVRIRNLSEGGAMIEGTALPDIGEEVTLRRNALAVTASAAWRDGRRCGLRFDRRISVAQWAGGVATAAAPAPAPSAPLRRDPADAPVAGASPLDRRLAEEIGYVVRLLAAVEDELADEPLLVQRHVGVLQNFDLAAQILGHLASVLNADNRETAIDAIGMTELRARLLRKPNF